VRPFQFVQKEEEPGSWDQGLEYNQVVKELERLMREARRKEQKKRYSNLAVCRIQVANGSRVSEAVDAWNQFLETGMRELWVRVRKRWRKDKETGQVAQKDERRQMLIPPCVDQWGVPRRKIQVCKFLCECGLRTHALRYAFIGHELDKGVSPVVVAKITHHKDLNMILHYAQKRLAKRELRQVVGEGEALGTKESPYDLKK